MTLIPLMDCCELLAIDPKTLRSYLKRAAMELTPHPTDARIKCLTLAQVQDLSAVHGRPLQPPGTSPAALLQGAAALVPSPMPPLCDQACSEMQGKATRTCSPAVQEESELRKSLSCLETRVMQLSEHLAQLALALLEERDRNVECRISVLETVIRELLSKPACPPPLPDQAATRTQQGPAVASKPARQLHPAEQQARSRMPPLIEYSAQGTYVIMSSLEGELHLESDSPEWFEWFATLSSFRFVGQQGRFTAYRESKHGRPSLDPPAQLQALVGRHRPADDHSFGASGGHPPGERGRALI
jgi:hypothetical protein